MTIKLELTREQQANILLLTKALRSNKYKQGYGQLRSKEKHVDTFCCMGVACDIFAEHSKQGRWIEEGVFLCSDENESSYTLPQAVIEWYGFDSSNPCVLFGRIPYSLSNLNDNLIISFLDIADAIEETFLKDVIHG